MPYSFDELVAHQRRRWMRPDAHLFVRPDARGFADCDAARWRERLLHRDHKLWNFHAAHHRRTTRLRHWRGNRRAPPAADLRACKRSTIRSGMPSCELQQERRRKRALERAEAERLKRRYDAAWDKFIAAFNRRWDTCRKAGFDPSQPRDERGRWTDGGDPDRPNIPKDRPPTAQLRNRVIKEVAKWLAKAAVREVAGPVGTFLNLVEAASWLYEAYPYVRAYLDERKTLDELQQAVRTRGVGYDVHHIAEQHAGRTGRLSEIAN